LSRFSDLAGVVPELTFFCSLRFAVLNPAANSHWLDKDGENILAFVIASNLARF
jgi:hypothetical protein